MSLHLSSVCVPSSAKLLQPVIFVLKRGSCFGALKKKWFDSLPQSAMGKYIYFSWFWLSQLLVSNTAPSLPLDSIWIWQREEARCQGVGWADGWMCVMCGVNVFPLNSSDSWSCMSACSTVVRWRENSYQLQLCLYKDHVTELLFLKRGDIYTLTCDSYSNKHSYSLGKIQL